MISETKLKTLEEIASSFGDKVVMVEDQDVIAEQAAINLKAKSQHLEAVTE
jgi:hypothetical protein